MYSSADVFHAPYVFSSVNPPESSAHSVSALGNVLRLCNRLSLTNRGTWANPNQFGMCVPRKNFTPD